MKQKKLRKETRVLGIDDSPFYKKNKKVLVIGVLFRGGDFLDGVLSTWVKVDGKDSTEKLIKMINKSRFKTNLKAILIDGIAFGGFNVIDINKLFEKTKIPVIVVIRNFPDYDKIYNTLSRLGMNYQKSLIQKLPKPTKTGNIYIQHIGITLEKAEKILELTTKHSFVPEPIRVAHLISAGIVKGESKGRA